jgi:hypothetical protein
MCNLSWAEKYGCRLVFGSIPDVTLDDALNDFLKVGKIVFFIHLIDLFFK